MVYRFEITDYSVFTPYKAIWHFHVAGAILFSLMIGRIRIGSMRITGAEMQGSIYVIAIWSNLTEIIPSAFLSNVTTITVIGAEGCSVEGFTVPSSLMVLKYVITDSTLVFAMYVSARTIPTHSGRKIFSRTVVCSTGTPRSCSVPTIITLAVYGFSTYD
jgi:hypothetical protein